MYCKYLLSLNLEIEEITDSDNKIVIKIYGKQISSIKNSILDEYGIHKLTRVSPFGNGKLHTSLVFISVHDIERVQKIIIKEADLKFEAFKAPGPGGQHKNKTMSAIRLKHIPSGIVTTANTRSQINSKDMALIQLKSKLFDKIQVENQGKKTDKLLNSKLNEKLVRSYLLNHSLIVEESTKKSSRKIKNILNGELNLIK